jgi:hypothetical protein
MNLIREIKQYQAPDGTCFNTKEEAEEYAELLKNPQFIKTQERIEKLENEVRELRAEIIAIKTTPKINPDIYPWQQPQVRFTPFSYQTYNAATGLPEQKDK